MTETLRTHRVLVIAYYFPPLGLSGVQRTSKFVKYLPQHGWHPSVLTVEDRAYFAKDAALLDELTDLPVQIHRTRSLDPLHLLRRKNVVQMPRAATLSLFGKISQTLLVPDNKIGWKRKAVAEGLRIIERDGIDVIFATAPPYTDFLIGEELRKRTGLPLVVDYRDAWVDNPLHFYATPLHRALHMRLEQRVLRAAAAIITINRPIKEQMVRRYDLVSHNDIRIIPHGYDQDDFTGLERTRKTDGKLRILHAGTFYYNRSPETLFRALALLGERHPETRGTVELHLVGSAREVDAAMVRRMGLEKQVITRGYLAHRDTVQELVNADVLWLLIGRGKGEGMMSTGKLFEYLGAMKPILATIPEGAARQVLEKCGAAFFTAPDDVEAIASQMYALYQLHKSHRLPVPSYSFVSQFDRNILTGALAKTLLSVVDTDAGQHTVHTRRASEAATAGNTVSSISKTTST
ncbi:MAG: glycosyltransferase family 4 protein [Bacteroidia bacterium]|nr:glycosyltransferase family 4 protein [Bacteroidia bacterium]